MLSKLLKSLARQPSFSFCSARLNNRGESLDQHAKAVDQPTIDVLVKHYRKFHLEQPIIEFRKVVLPAKRMRTVDDHLEDMKKILEVPAVIRGREEFPDVDVVFDHFQLSAMKRRVNSNVAPIYVRLPNGEDIRCILEKMSKHYLDNWLIKVYLTRYIVGRPNLMFIPFQLEHNYKNAFLNRGSVATTTLGGAWVYCYNETYPGVFQIDCTNASPARPYKLGDLQNSLPEGIILHERYAKLMHLNVVSLGIDQERKLVESVRTIKRLGDDKDNKKGDVAEEDLDGIDGYEAQPKVEKVRKEPKKKKATKSQQMKQDIANAQAEIKKNMELLNNDGKPAKKK